MASVTRLLHIQSPSCTSIYPRRSPGLDNSQHHIAGGVKGNFIHMRIVGLTGGIASGKSTVSDLFRSSGVPVVDADIVARDVVRKGTPGLRKVAIAFGDDILLENGEINRSRLGQIVFSDPAKRQLLNRLLAPHISSSIFWEIVKLWVKGCKVILLDIPLLFEAKMDRWMDPIIVVWINPEAQLQRLMVRDGISEEEARTRLIPRLHWTGRRQKLTLSLIILVQLRIREHSFRRC
ncbi:hypothetical protein KSP40_PGU015298 [Platanthera guangdongensis]|uniref:Dephospho-CoA kinase n=1 Tax=Platanthera guangdongensis TaxID=2320717 RepID=A0ABR2MXA2_9ASPA